MTVKKKIIISISIFIVFTGLIVYFIILPTAGEIKEIKEAVYTERVDLEKKYLRGQLLKKTLEDFEKIRPKKEKLSSVFVIEGKELEFIQALEKIAAFYNLEQNLKLQQLKDGEENNDYYYPLALEVLIEGDFTQTLGYLKSLERLNYYFNIYSINISAGETDNSVTTSLKGEIYALNVNLKEEE